MSQASISPVPLSVFFFRIWRCRRRTFLFSRLRCQLSIGCCHPALLPMPLPFFTPASFAGVSRARTPRRLRNKINLRTFLFRPLFCDAIPCVFAVGLPPPAVFPPSETSPAPVRKHLRHDPQGVGGIFCAATPSQQALVFRLAGRDSCCAAYR